MRMYIAGIISEFNILIDNIHLTTIYNNNKIMKIKEYKVLLYLMRQRQIEITTL